MFCTPNQVYTQTHVRARTICITHAPSGKKADKAGFLTQRVTVATKVFKITVYWNVTPCILVHICHARLDQGNTRIANTGRGVRLECRFPPIHPVEYLIKKALEGF